MVFGCRHNFEYSRGHFSCSKCGMRAKENRFKRNHRNHNKSYVAIAIIGVIIIGGIYAYGNYDITLDEQKLNRMLPLTMIEQKFDELYQTIPTESIESSIETLQDSIPIKMEEKPVKLEDKLLDCSKYKREYLESYQNVKTTEDNMEAMMGDALAGVQKTKECERYNWQLKNQQALQNTIESGNAVMETTPNKILVGWAMGHFIYAEMTPNNLILIENLKYNEIRFKVTAEIIDLRYDQWTLLESYKTFLIDQNSKKYTSNCTPGTILDGKKTDTSFTFGTCYEIGKDVKKLDIMFPSQEHYNPNIPSTNVKIGTIQIKN